MLLLVRISIDAFAGASTIAFLSNSHWLRHFILEILKNIPHDERVDQWAIGIVIFVLLVGYPPFLEENQAVLFDKIRRGEWTFYERDWGKISAEAKELIRGLLAVDPKERWSIEEALRCKWIKQDPSTLSNINLSESINSLRTKRNRLRTMAKAVIWTKDNNVCEDVPTQAQHASSGQLMEE
jgi:serine/threonine protein kinase